jgi:polyisoprenoid-binding protein YceI
MNRLAWPLTLLLANSAAFSAETLAIDPSHSAVIFSWNHRGFSHPIARLEKIDGRVILDRADLTRSSVSLTLALDGLRTGDDALDRRLEGAEFFDAARYPRMTFKSTRVEALGSNALRITGDLSVRDITHQVVLDVRINKISADSANKVTAGFDADTALRRSDFGVSRYVPMVSDELSVHITLEAGQT